MFYRVDYAVAVICVGFIVGSLFSGLTANLPPLRLVRGYYVVVLGLLVLRTGAFADTMLMSHATFWRTASGLIGDLLGFLFGALFGLATRRKDAREILTSSPILETLCVMLAFTFALAGIGKAFSVAPMTEFFVQSGYSAAFLKFIVMAEIFGSIGLLLPWAVLPALIGLAVDMFGAVLTHIHNGDPLNDSTGAIGMLIRLITVGVLITLRQRSGRTLPSVRSAVLRTTTATITCLLIAVGGSAAIRHLSPPTPEVTSPGTKRHRGVTFRYHVEVMRTEKQQGIGRSGTGALLVVVPKPRKQ